MGVSRGRQQEVEKLIVKAGRNFAFLSGFVARYLNIYEIELILLTRAATSSSWRLAAAMRLNDRAGDVARAR